MSAIQKFDSIPFHGAELQALQQPSGEVFVALKPMCEALGVDAKSQRAKL